jgi:hypothetical protein
MLKRKFCVASFSFLTIGRNMTVELDSRHPLLPKTGWEYEDLTLILRETNGNFCRYKCFQCWCKGEKTREQRKLQLLKIKSLWEFL